MCCNTMIHALCTGEEGTVIHSLCSAQEPVAIALELSDQIRTADGDISDVVFTELVRACVRSGEVAAAHRIYSEVWLLMAECAA